MSSSDDDETTCHILPCNIEFQGMAPNHLYFQPRKVEQENNNDNDDGSGNNSSEVSSAMFRGRGLLAKEGKSAPAALLAVDVNSGQVQIKSTTTKIMEWHHEHMPEALQYDDESTSSGRIQYAQEWVEIADAVSALIQNVCPIAKDFL